MRRGSANNSPSIKLGGREDDDPVVTCRVILDELVEDVAREGPGTEDSEELKGDDRWVGDSPASVGFGILSP